MPFIKVPLILKPTLTTVNYLNKNCDIIKYVDIQIKVICHINNVQQYLFYTKDEELALQLGSEFLPGQQKEIQRLNKESFSKGICFALNEIFKS